ncbi:MAG TPA: DUF4870 domain-containing protein [Phycisphaerae bacterium]|nr:DUF4870 domain-containing protein [Phycisphaerae bacterium]HRW52108.1 DUF4870 domain-containing protein [Phycisphaerae bacterium]
MSTTQAATINKDDIESGRLFSILSYLIPFFFLVPMIQRTNAFATFHARQALAIIILAMALGAVAWILPMALLGIVSPVFLLAQVTLIVIGVIHAARGETKQLPILGAYAEKLFNRANI